MDDPTQPRPASAGNPLRALLQAPPPSVAVPITDRLGGDDLASLLELRPDALELRVDRCATRDPAHLRGFLERLAGPPLLATIRTREEGGDWDGGPSGRAELFGALLPEVEGIDVELAAAAGLGTLVADARAAGAVVVLSHHDLTGTPDLDVLRRIDADALEAGAEYVKVATTVQSSEDLRTLARFTLCERAHGVIVVGMGAAGALSRVFLPALGSRLTYAAFGVAHAPGQLELQEMRPLLSTFYPATDGR